MKTITTLLFFAVLFISCNSAHNSSTQVNEVADGYVKAYFTMYPEQALTSGAPDLFPDRLSDNSLTALEAWDAKVDSLLGELNSIDATTLTGRDVITYGFVKNRLEASVNTRVCNMNLWNVSPTYNGWQNALSFVFASLPVETQQEKDNANSRLSQLSRYIHTEIDNLKEGVSQGYVAPKSGVEAVIGQMNALLQTEPESTPFAAMASGADEAFKQKILDLITDDINPAIEAYRDYLRDEYIAVAREVVGVSANPNGNACYQASTEDYISASFTADEIHQSGLNQLEIIFEQMREIGERSLGTDDPAEILRIVKEEKEYRFTSRQHVIESAEGAVGRAEAALTDWFGFVPEMESEVIPYPPYQEKTAPLGQAIPPAADGSQPGKYVINTYEPEKQTTSMLEPLSFHEAYPGHLFQIYVSLGTDTHPVTGYFFISGFGEGWALYSERLAEEMGLYSSDVDRIGWLASEAHRAARLVVDSGMHALGWTRQQSIDFLEANTTLTSTLATAETDRYIAVPGQATSYMMGALEIMRLRKEAEQALGERFDIKEFHDLLLEDGTVPLVMMREKVERWVEGS